MANPSILTKDPMCGMTVDEATAIWADRDQKRFYFCGEQCRKKFLALKTVPNPKGPGKGCCG